MASNTPCRSSIQKHYLKIILQNLLINSSLSIYTEVSKHGMIMCDWLSHENKVRYLKQIWNRITCMVEGRLEYLPGGLWGLSGGRGIAIGIGIVGWATGSICKTGGWMGSGSICIYKKTVAYF